MTLPEKEQRPGVESEALSESFRGDALIVPAARALLGDLDALAEHLRGVYVCQVTVDDAGHKRTHYYRNLAAVERAVDRARQRGRTVHVSLVQLVPVGVVQGVVR